METKSLVKNTDEFSLYDIACAALVLLPVILTGVVLAVGLSMLVVPVSAAVITDGLKIECRFDEGSGQVLTDYSGNNINGTLGSSTGADAADPTWGSGYLAFNTDDYVSFPAPTSDITGNYTVQIVVQNNLDATKTMMGKFEPGNDIGDGLYINTISGNISSFYHHTANRSRVITNQRLPIYDAVLLTAQYDGSDIYLHNGISWGSNVTSTGFSPATPNTFRLGGKYSFLTGNISYFVVYNRTLSHEEIAQNYEYLVTLMNSRGLDIRSPTNDPLSYTTTRSAFQSLGKPIDEINFYGYGDSVTVATGGDLAPDGSDNYLFQMKTTYSLGGVFGHNSDGSGRNSTWGLANISSHYNATYDVYPIMFGSNDYATGLNVSTSTQNIEDMSDYISSRGKIPLILIGAPRKYSGSIQVTEYLYSIELLLKGDGYEYIRMYDAVDQNSTNNMIDDIVQSYYYDTVHPNKTGHKKMGDYFYNILMDEMFPPVASFSTNTTSGTVPLAVAFTDTSTNSPTGWNWSFGDGVWNNGTNSTIAHLYTSAGVFNTSLIASNAAGSNQSANTTITVNGIPIVANFTSNVTWGTGLFDVQFNDTSTGGIPDNWDWYAGADETKTSDDQNATITFSSAGGPYNIRLYASNTSEGTGDWENKTGYIRNPAVPTATPVPSGPAAVKDAYGSDPTGIIAIIGIILVLPTIIGVTIGISMLKGNSSFEIGSGQLVAVAVATLIIIFIISLIVYFAGAVGA